MKYRISTTIFLLFISFSTSIYAQNDQKEVLQITQQFFQALEQNDSLAFRQIFLPDAYNYYVLENQDSLRVGSQSPSNFKFQKDRIIKERFRENTVEVKVHKNIATVWGFYDLWVNDEFSHCGIDAFTFLKTNEGWKISSVSFTIEKEGCE